MPIVECVPNVSEGRRPEVIDACARAIRDGGAALLDIHTDPDHNRSVFTFAGAPTDVHASAIALVATAAERIDLRQHRGVHPRMGAVDVMPFVPLADVTLEDAVRLARSVGLAIGDKHRIPVYLYAASASRPDRERLEDIRRGQFEGLGSRVGHGDWAPDFGPAEPHPAAGIMAVGARKPLIAFNVVLDTDRLDVARLIARTIRERDGGLPAVKALGLSLESRALVQVSLNLTDYQRSSPAAVLARIADEAAKLGVSIKESELVGLAPAAALPSDPATALRLAGPTKHYTIEAALAEAGLSA